MADLERWKRRSTEELRARVDVLEANAFGRLDLLPNWANMEPIEVSVERHFAFLRALLEDLEGEALPASALPEPQSQLSPIGGPTIFLSHAAADFALAEFLELTIRRSLGGCDVFRTSRAGQIPSGKAWFQHIGDHLRSADRYVVLLTPASQARPWVAFETGAAWMTGRALVPVLGGGLAFASVIEPLRNLQLLSLEIPEHAKQVFRELGGDLHDAPAFVEQAQRLGAMGKEVELQNQGWEQLEYEGNTYAWDGPLEELKESHGVPLPDGLLDAFRRIGMRPTTGMPGNLWGEYSKGHRQVWFIDSRLRKHPVVSRDRQVLLVRSDDNPKL